ncbi:MAG: ATP-binding protein, partial [Hydrogenophaga sp.]|nr:ATP-binding protein [Hydrogenophaga sp.]
YVGGRSISIPRWYLEMNGHELENALKSAFPPLKRFRNENDLKSDLIKKVATDYPDFIPVDFFELFNSIQIQHST